MRYIFSFICVLFSLSFSQNTQVVVSIKPLHSIVSYLLQGVTEPELLIQGDVHHVSLTPSQVMNLKGAALVIRIGPEFESYLNDSLGSNPNVFNAIKLPNIKIYYNRAQCNCDHSNHKHETDHKHNHSFNSDKPIIDGHIWLSLDNALVIAQALSVKLKTIFNRYQSQIDTNFIQFKNKIIDLKNKLKPKISKLNNQIFMATHNGYQYFEKDFNFTISHFIHLNQQTTFNTLTQLEEHSLNNKPIIMFYDGEINLNLLEKIKEYKNIRPIFFDGEGISLKEGKECYFDIFKDLLINL